MEQSYKEKYEQALAKAKEQYNYPCMRSCMGILEEIFPELKEPEDEKIRKWLITQLELKSDVNNPHDLELMILKSIAWLERQGEHANFRNKIQVGDKVTRNENGVLVNLSQLKRVAKPRKKQSEQKASYTTIVETGDGGINTLVTRELPTDGCDDEQKPEENKGNIGGISPDWSEEDKQHIRTIIHAIHGAGNITPIDGELAEDWLKSLQDRVQPKPQPKYNFGDTELTQEELCEGLIRGMVDEHNRVTKEVLRNEYEKGRADAIAEMQKEWSDVDKDILFRIIDDLKFLRDTISIDPKYAVNIIDMEREITWLKSLRPQNRWKPSELQLECLSDAIKHYNSWGYPAPKLKELLDDLKKLKEE